jgi:hypothetical protein
MAGSFLFLFGLGGGFLFSHGVGVLFFCGVSWCWNLAFFRGACVATVVMLFAARALWGTASLAGIRLGAFAAHALPLW